MADVEDAASWPDLPFAKKNQAAEAGAKGTPPPGHAKRLDFGSGAKPPAAQPEKASGSAPVPTGPGAQKSRLEKTKQAPPPPPPHPPQATPGVDKIDRPPRPGVPLKLDTAMQRVSVPSSNTMKRSQSISHQDWLKKNPKRKSTLHDIQDIEDKGGKSSPVKFVPAKWEGPKKGYIHRTSVLGTGYYRETEEIKQRRAMTAGGTNSVLGLHPMLQGSGLTIANVMAASRGKKSLDVLHEESDDWSDSTASETSAGLQRVREHVKFADEYQMVTGKGIWASADADWLTAQLAEQYRQERLGHNYSMAANVHKNPTYRGENMLWNVIDKKSRENLSYYERMHETEISGTVASEGQIAGGWEEVLKSKDLSKFLPDPKEIDSRPVSELKYTWEEESSKGSTTLSDADCAPRDLGYETDWLATPTFGVTGKKEYQQKANQERDYQKKYYASENALRLHRALQRDSKRQVGHRFYITHNHPGVGNASTARLAVWNHKAKPHKHSGANNPKPERLKEGIRAARNMVKNYIRHQQNLVNDSLQHQRDVQLRSAPTVRSMSTGGTSSQYKMRKRRSSVAREKFDQREHIPVTSQYDGVDAYM